MTIKNYLHVKLQLPMSKEQTRVFAHLFLREAGDDPLSDAQIEELGFSARLLFVRLKHHKVEATNEAVAFLACLARHPGDCVLWGHTMAQMNHELGRKVTLKDVAEYFPYGFPSDEARQEIWDAQKTNNGNLVDTDAAWSSFLPR